MLHTKRICGNCDAFCAPENKCSLNPVHVEVTEDHFCQQWRNAQVPRSFGVHSKLQDRDLHAYICSEETGIYWTYRELVQNAATKFMVSERTIEERFRKLIRLGYARFQIGQEEENAGKRYLTPTVEEVDGMTVLVKWKGKDGPESGAPPIVPNKKYDWMHVAPAMPKDKTGISYNDLAKKSASMGRASFNRIIKEAIEAGKIEKIEGLYRLK